MGKITKAMIEKSFDLGKDFFHQKISRQEAIQSLKETGMNENSAGRYLYTYSKLIQGEAFTSTISVDAIRYYLKKIREDDRQAGREQVHLQKALHSLDLHIKYYEDKAHTSVKTQRKIYYEFLEFIDNQSKHVVHTTGVDRK